MNVTRLSSRLLIGFLMALVVAGCSHQKIKPTRPTLKIEPYSNGGMCLDKENARKLGVYIWELENY